MQIHSWSVRGSNEWNEDALLIREEEQVFAVIDGATSLVPYRSASGETGGYLASRLAAKVLQEATFQPGVNSLVDALLAANRELRQSMLAQGIDVTQKEALWSACTLLVRVTPYTVEYAQTGDCMLVAEYADGTFRIVTRDQVDFLDSQTQRLWAKGIQEGITDKAKLWEYVLPQITNGRRLTNTINGYAVLNGDPELRHYIETGTINRMNLQSVLLLTDGLFIPTAKDEPALGLDEVARLVRRNGLQAYIDWLIEREQADAACERYPRVKVSDDKTAIWVQFS